ncbi:hypothetical protein Moror_12435 [Moniliophthora roreri MCA 2997]|uniref:Uncharacterized protein n=2 Tax=Moniliophthora roreri TaxID=221103 RepID=V2X9G6_MONRO|nr:hypothetical protein Moror_12435 [Moniliophthora roreri MCA 2997]KAI3616056.1 hypothetical protein WG66_014023 [Moniliophthora roreri]
MASFHVSLCFLLAVVFVLVTSAPLAKRDVFVPPVLYPHAETVWRVGDLHNVTWDTSNPPAQITNQNGSIVLAKNGRLLLNNPGYLAKGFPILNGRQEIQVPNVEPGDDYTIVVFGDSGNHGERFTIVQ